MTLKTTASTTEKSIIDNKDTKDDAETGAKNLNSHFLLKEEPAFYKKNIFVTIFTSSSFTQLIEETHSGGTHVKRIDQIYTPETFLEFYYFNSDTFCLN